jgi:hypothetical protein
VGLFERFPDLTTFELEYSVKPVPAQANVFDFTFFGVIPHR